MPEPPIEMPEMDIAIYVTERVECYSARYPVPALVFHMAHGCGRSFYGLAAVLEPDCPNPGLLLAAPLGFNGVRKILEMAEKGRRNMSSRTRTMYAFSDRERADRFVNWLRRNAGDHNYGEPCYVDLCQVSGAEWCVEYEYNSDNPVARGVAIGIEM